MLATELLATRALAALNEDARYVLYVVAETGMRPSEIVNLQDDAHSPQVCTTRYSSVRPLNASSVICLPYPTIAILSDSYLDRRPISWKDWQCLGMIGSEHEALLVPALSVVVLSGRGVPEFRSRAHRITITAAAAGARPPQ